eukprot:TRINITY_DN11069_c0_g1_i1.p1 TRINITY_DN11069_c0_g1~~TRINITY_DN11069_c0_g1_i1.p1  ORF type:complete len:451 (+),score=126.05 TRINITY_DN11069_c0_g1_i1:1-1353(+)
MKSILKKKIINNKFSNHYNKYNIRNVSTYINKGNIGVFQAIQGLGQPQNGSEEFPDLLRQWSLYQKFEKVGANIIQKEIIKQDKEDWVSKSANKLNPTQILNAYEIGKFTRELREKVRRNAMEGNMTLTLGGCQSSSIGTIRGITDIYPDVHVLWVDGNSGMNLGQGLEDGSVKRMGVSLLTGIVNPKTVHNFEWLQPPLDYFRVHTMGYKQLSTLEKEMMERYSIPNVSGAEIHKYGMEKVIHHVIQKIDRHWNVPLHLSFSASAFDSAICDNAYGPNGKGLSRNDVRYLFKKLRETKRLVGVDICDFNAHLGDKAKVTQNMEMLVDLLAELFTPISEPVLPKGYYEYVDEIKNKAYWFMYPSSWLPVRWEKARSAKGMGDQELSVHEKKMKVMNKLKSQGLQAEYKAKGSRRRWKRRVQEEKRFKKSRVARALRASGKTLELKYLKKW